MPRTRDGRRLLVTVEDEREWRQTGRMIRAQRFFLLEQAVTLAVDQRVVLVLKTPEGLREYDARVLHVNPDAGIGLEIDNPEGREVIPPKPRPKPAEETRAFDGSAPSSELGFTRGLPGKAPPVGLLFAGNQSMAREYTEGLDAMVEGGFDERTVAQEMPADAFDEARYGPSLDAGESVDLGAATRADEGAPEGALSEPEEPSARGFVEERSDPYAYAHDDGWLDPNLARSWHGQAIVDGLSEGLPVPRIGETRDEVAAGEIEIDDFDDPDNLLDERQIARILAEGLNDPTPPATDETYQTLYARLMNLTVYEKQRLALCGNRMERSFLIRDPVKALHVLVLRNPRVGPDELIEYTGFPNLSRRAIQVMARNPTWMASPRLRSNLVRHPNTPPEVMKRLALTLPIPELRFLLRHEAVRPTVKNAVAKILERMGMG